MSPQRKQPGNQKAQNRQQQRRQGQPENVQEIIQRNESDPDLTKWQLNGEDLLQELEAKLKGVKLKRDNAGNVVDTEDVGEQMLPDERIDELLDLCSLYLNKSMQLSEFTETQIDQLMRDLKKDLVDYFEMCYINQEIDKQQLDLAMHIGNFIWGSLARAKYGGERKFIGEHEQRTITTNPQDSGQDSRFGWIPGL